MSKSNRVTKPTKSRERHIYYCEACGIVTVKHQGEWCNNCTNSLSKKIDLINSI